MNRLRIILAVLFPMLLVTIFILGIGGYLLVKSDRERALASLESKVRLFGDNLTKNSDHFVKQVQIFTSMLNLPPVGKMERYLQQMLKDQSDIQTIVVAYDPDFLKEVSAGKHPGFHVHDYFTEFGPDEHKNDYALYCYRDKENKIKLGSDIDHSYETEEWFLLPRYVEQGQWTNPFVTRETHELVCAFGLPFYYRDKLAGIVSCFVSFDELIEMDQLGHRAGSLFENGRFLVTASNGQILYDSKLGIGKVYSIYSVAEEAGRDDIYPLCDRIMDEDFGIIEFPNFDLNIDAVDENAPSLWLCYLRMTKNSDWSILAVVTDRELLSGLYQKLTTFGALTFIVVLLLGGTIATFFVHANEPLFEMMALAQRAEQGDYKGQVQKRFTDRKNNLGLFATTFNKMLSSMEDHIDVAVQEGVLQTRLEQEIDIAHELQSSFLPLNEFHYNPEQGYAIQAKLISAVDIGGDFYDLWRLDDDTVAFLVADVAGKGIAAAMCMVAARTMIRQVSEKYSEPGEVFAHVNDALLLAKRSGMFITAFLGFYKPKESTLLYCNAGHEPPFIFDQKKVLHEFDYARNSVLGSLHDENFVTEKLILKPSEILLLYSNGIQNAMSPDGEQYGKKRFVDLLNEVKDTTTDRIIPTIVRSLETFMDTPVVDDDITLFILKHTLPLPKSTTTAWSCNETIVSDYGNGDHIMDKLLEVMTEKGWSDRDSFAVNMAFVEGINNAIEHGNDLDSSKKVHIKCEVTSNQVVISIRDEGPGFREDLIPDPRQRRRLSCPTGRGVLLIRNFMSRVTFNESGNEIQMEKYRSEVI